MDNLCRSLDFDRPLIHQTYDPDLGGMSGPYYPRRRSVDGTVYHVVPSATGESMIPVCTSPAYPGMVGRWSNVQ